LADIAYKSIPLFEVVYKAKLEMAIEMATDRIQCYAIEKYNGATHIVIDLPNNASTR